MTIEEIYYSENVSVRSFNVCNDNDLTDLTTILNYYRKNKTFENLRNCGKKSNEELIALCLKYIEKNSDYKELTNPENLLLPIIHSLTRNQRDIVKNFIEVNFNNLSNRSKNAINSFLNGNLNIRNISEKILINDRFSIQDIKNVGAKSEVELNTFINSVRDFIEKVSNIENENNLIALRNRFFIEKTFSISVIPNEILESQSIFKLTYFLINQNAIYEKNQNFIFQKAFKIYENQPELTSDEIAEELNISRERVRQLRKSCLEDLFKSLQFVKHIDDDLFQNYGIELNQTFIDIDESLINHINKTSNTNFTKEFIIFLIYVFISDDFELIGNAEDVIQPKHFNTRNRHNWYGFYLVSSNINKEFDFTAFANDIDIRLNGRIEETYFLNFKSYLSNFLLDNNFDIIISITTIAEKILNDEFGVYLDLEDNITFYRNSHKQVFEYAYEALKLIGKPSMVNDITAKIEQLHPDYEINDAKVRASMKRQNGFVPIGRMSMFGLKEWENKLENFKGGTIREIVMEYLEDNLLPQHFSDITCYVLQFRPESNEYSIIQNLKLDESGTFIFFKNSLIGLSNKIYDNSHLYILESNTKEKKSWEERYANLIDFINTNNRLPVSSGGSDNEIRIYRWYNIQVGKIEKGDLDDLKCDLINDVNVKFGKSKSFRKKRLPNIVKGGKLSGNSYTINDLVEFISDNHRMPDSRNPNEGNLYHFYYRNKIKFENTDDLSIQEIKLNELITKYRRPKHIKHTIDDLIIFIKDNRRMPDSRNPHERGLYHFYYRQKKLFESEDLDQFEIKAFVDLTKIIQNNYENK